MSWWRIVNANYWVFQNAILLFAAIKAKISKHLSGSNEKDREQEMWILKQDEMHTNRSGIYLTRMALNSQDVASGALCLRLVNLKTISELLYWPLQFTSSRQLFCRSVRSRLSWSLTVHWKVALIMLTRSKNETNCEDSIISLLLKCLCFYVSHFSTQLVDLHYV